jgi:hypothetical protein
MADSKPKCGLCGQRVLIPGFELNTLLGQKKILLRRLSQHFSTAQ